jgi:hypothetical protein
MNSQTVVKIGSYSWCRIWKTLNVTVKWKITCDEFRGDKGYGDIEWTRRRKRRRKV